MNFFAAQQKAKSSTTYLIFAFIIGLLALLCVIDLFVVFVLATFVEPHNGTFSLYVTHYMQNGTLPAISAVIVAIVGIGALYQNMKLSHGGKAVAEDLGARALSKQSANIHEKTLLNIVEEMSLASGVPAPDVYTLDDESINAFVAGHDINDTIVCVTKGSMEKLNRQELQGVIAHEFSHVFNGDMRLSMKISSVVFGMLSLGTVGYWMFRLSSQTSSSSRNEKDNGKALFLVLGIGLYILGYIGVFVGNIIKANISRQREYLADATAVKYTRDTSGIANALKKIGSVGGLISSENAKSYSHFYFAEGVSNFFGNIFATHPPLDKRIWRIEPDWDGVYPELQKAEIKSKEEAKQSKKDKMYKTILSSVVLERLESSGTLNEKDISNATTKLEQIPKSILLMSEDGLGAMGLVLALLAKDLHEVPQSVVKEFASKNPKLFREVLKSLDELIELKKSDYLTVLLLCIPSLKLLSLNQYKSFRQTLQEWIWANQKIVFFEWIVKRIIISQLDVFFNIPQTKNSKSLSKKDELSFFVSFLALHESEDEILAKNLFEKALSHEKLNGYSYISQDKLDYIEFGRCLDALALHDAGVKKSALKMAIYVLSDDNEISTQNTQMLHALSLGLKVPLPLM